MPYLKQKEHKVINGNRELAKLSFELPAYISSDMMGILNSSATANIYTTS
jgi:hypothetical protein